MLSIRSAMGNGVGGSVSFATVFDEAVMAIASEQFDAVLAELATLGFWTAATDDNWRPEAGLWLPQRRAAEFAQAYLACCAATGAAAPEAALVKMPTGTGKTAVIAALACASPNIQRTLIITPREALVEQMRRDLSYRFWDRLGAVYKDHEVETGATAAEREQAKGDYEAGQHNSVWILGSDRYSAIWNDRAAPRQIVVSTFNALHRILGKEPPAHRRFHGRSAPTIAAGFPILDPERTAAQNHQAFVDHLKSFDLVIVDEGHYEPAISWAQSVRALERPTLIFSATPYRNDYKYFNVNGNFAFNLPWAEAVANRLVRDVLIEPPLVAPAEPEGQSTAAGFAAACEPFLAALPPGKLAIVHARSFEQLIELQNAFSAIGEQAVLVHDAYRKPSDEKLAEMTDAERALYALRFRQVRQVEGSQPAAAARLWLHQYKLLEGVDDPRFVEVWLFDPLKSARQFVQQVGRVIRRPDLQDPDGQQAKVRASGRSFAQSSARTIHEQAAARWEDYIAYERFIADKREQAFTAETQLLATVKRSAPEIQYVAREFRSGHLLDETPGLDAFLVPRRATICRVRDVIDHAADAISDAKLDELAARAREAMEVEERFDIQPVVDPDPERGRDVRLFRYLAWQSSPLLRDHHLPEWRLGLLAIARAGRYIFLLDTEAMCLDTARLGLIEPDPAELKRLFPKDGTRIVETSAGGLDVGEYGIRSLTLRKQSLEQGYFDLAEASQVPTAVRGYGPLDQGRARRRLSLGRSSVADSSYANIGILDWLVWTRSIAEMLADEKIVQNAYFGRFAEQRKPLRPAKAKPKSILLDLWDLLDPESDQFERRDWNAEVARAWIEADNCLPVRNEGTAERPRYEFDFAGVTIRLDYLYRDSIPVGGRYRLSSQELNNRICAKGDPAEQVEADPDDDAGLFGSATQPSLTALLNQAQSFRIIPAESNTVYAHGSFYKPRVDAGLFSILEHSNAIADIVSEKGDTRVHALADWNSQTLFGLMWDWLSGAVPPEEKFAQDMCACDIVICDDGTKETADFYGIDDANQRIYIVHSKASTGPASATARKLQEVGRQAQTSLAFAASSATGFALPQDWAKKWSVTLKDAGAQVLTKPRMFKAPAGLSMKQAHTRLKRGLENPAYSKHVVIQTSGMLSEETAKATLNSTAQTSRQFLYYLASLRTAFDRAGVKLRIICNP